MKRFFPIIWIAASLLISCNRDKPTPDPEPDPKPESKWEANDKTPRVLSNTPGACQLKTVRAADGKIILSWLKPGGGNWDSPRFGYYLYLQVFNADGSTAFGADGITVSQQPTMTYTTDYSLSLAPNGDILLAYWDTRNDAGREKNEIYLYRYSQDGTPVWSKDGVRFVTGGNGNAESPSICVSGSNIYVGTHAAYGENSTFQINALDQDGAPLWAHNIDLNARTASLRPAPGGDLYVLYNNESYGLDAIRLNASGSYVWGKAVTVESSALGDDLFIGEPKISEDGNDGLFLSYRLLENWAGYQVFNYLTSSGNSLPGAVSCNGENGGDAGAAVLGSRSGKALVAWVLDEGLNHFKMMANLFDRSGLPAWGNGITLGRNNDWGFSPVAVIPRSDGWILLYGDCTAWNAAKFMAVKLNDSGETLWSRQLGPDAFLSSGFSVEYDASNAYIFYSYDDEDTGKGGMCVLCISL